MLILKSFLIFKRLFNMIYMSNYILLKTLVERERNTLNIRLTVYSNDLF